MEPANYASKVADSLSSEDINERTIVGFKASHQFFNALELCYRIYLFIFVFFASTPVLYVERNYINIQHTFFFFFF